MKTFSKYAILIFPLLVVLGSILTALQWVGWGISITVLGLALGLLHFLLLSSKVKEVSALHFQGLIKGGVDVLEAASNQILKSNKNMTATLTAILKIQEGKGKEINELTLDSDTGKAVINLNEALERMKEQEIRQNWVVTGMARLSGIRKQNSDLNDYCFQITSELVKYLEANQAAFYTLSQEDANPILELEAAYAYGRRKFAHEKVTIEVGSGLVGQSVQERELILMTNVPQDYVKITSGLGQATPRCIIIAPLIFKEKVYGAIELASFQVFEKHQIDFVKQVSESIAAELADVLTQSKTNLLLKQSQEQAQELKAQEEELRQNMEEMQATQEEMKRKEVQLVQNMKELNLAQVKMKEQEQELKLQLKQVLTERRKNQAILEGCVDGVVSFDIDGRIQFFNSAAEEIFGLNRGEAVNAKIQDLVAITISNDNDEWKLLTANNSIISVRTEVQIQLADGDSISVLITSTRIQLPDGLLFTLFVQKISIDLF